MDNCADKVEMVLAYKVVEYMFVTVLAKRPKEGGRMGSDPTVKGQERLYGPLHVHLCGVRAYNTMQS